jgi:lysine-N-methylase
VQALLDLLRNRRDPMERRLRKCLALAHEMRKAKLDDIKGNRLEGLLDLMKGVVDAEAPANPQMVALPGWVGRILFRQAAALFTRKDHGPNRGVAGQGRLALMGAAWRFARGTGRVPRMHRGLPEADFADLETPRGPLPEAAEQVLERYYALKVGSLQFCGSAQFGLPFWDGFELLVLTFPILLWVARMYRDLPREEAVVRALSIVDDHFGFNRMLSTARQRLSFQILARTGELGRLVAWYSR